MRFPHQRHPILQQLVSDSSTRSQLADVVAEYGFAFPHTPNSAGAVAQHFFGFVQHMNSYFFSHGPNKTDGIVTGVSRRMYLSPLPSPRDRKSVV